MEEQLKSLKWYKNLHTKKFRNEVKCFLLEGDKKIEQIVGCARHLVEEVIGVEDKVSSYSEEFKTRFVSERQFASISRHKSPQGIAAVIKIPDDLNLADVLEDAKRVLFLDDVQDPGNVGTLIRTAAAFDFDGIVLSDKCADVYSPKVVDASSGALFSLWVKEAADIKEALLALKGEGFNIAVADLVDDSANAKLADSDKIVIVLGSEGQGVSKSVLEMADFKITIDINREKAESLNVAVCGALMMHMAVK